MQAYIVRHWNYISILDVNIWCFWLLMFAKIYLRWQDEWICFCVLYLFLPSCLFYADHKPGDILGKSARKWTQGWDSHVFVGQKKNRIKKKKRTLWDEVVVHCHQNCWFQANCPARPNITDGSQQPPVFCEQITFL